MAAISPSEIDFTSGTYLGIRNASRSLRSWSRLTTGKPAVLETVAVARRVAKALANLQGCDRAILLPSTLHLFFDLFDVLRHDGIRIYVDAAAYPIAVWGAKRAAGQGVRLRPIPHYDPAAAIQAIEMDIEPGLRPVILADGFCAQCGRSAPLREYLASVIPNGGYVVLDDTQALGICGSQPGLATPYGSGGGGSLRLHAVRSPHVILGSSLAKGFGVPVAALSGPATIVDRFIRQSETMVHSSPPSIPVLHAAEHALLVNARRGDQLRFALAQMVIRFRDHIRAAGLRAPSTLFPVQTLVPAGLDAVRLQLRLQKAGIRTAVVRRHASPELRLAFIITALHSGTDIDQAVVTLLAVMREQCAARSLSDLCEGWRGPEMKPESEPVKRDKGHRRSESARSIPVPGPFGGH